MNGIQVEQKSYQMPPLEGMSVAHFLTVADIERSARFYETVFGGRILSRGDSSGAPGYIQIANTWLIVNVGGGPDARQAIGNAQRPRRPGFSQQLHEYSRCGYSCLLRTLGENAEPNLSRSQRTNTAKRAATFRDPDGYIIEVGQSKPDLHLRLITRGN